MREVYCSECIHHEIAIYWGYDSCHHKELVEIITIKKTPMHREEVRKCSSACKDNNKNNDCKHFEKGKSKHNNGL